MPAGHPGDVELTADRCPDGHACLLERPARADLRRRRRGPVCEGTQACSVRHCSSRGLTREEACDGVARMGNVTVTAAGSARAGAGSVEPGEFGARRPGGFPCTARYTKR